MAVAAEPPSHVIEAWFKAVYRHCDGWITLFSIDKETGARFTDWALTNSPEEIAAVALRRSVSCDVWYGVATRKERLANGSRGGASDCLHIPALWADIDILGPNHAAKNLPPDIDAARRLLADYPLAPTVTVHSGGGLQPLWILAEPLDADAASGFLERWTYTWTALAERHGWHLDNVWDVARVMRVPGTQNRKHDPVDVRIIEINKGRRYGVDDLDQWVIEPPVKEPTRPAVAYIGPQRPGDAFNAVRSGAEILEAVGFALERTDSNGDRHYHVPGAANGTGATVYGDDGHTTIWSETATARWPGLQVRRPYDSFGLYSHLNHGGNWVAASDELARLGYGTKHVADLPPIITASSVDSEEPSESSWVERDLTKTLNGLKNGTIQRPSPTLCRRSDDKCLFYASRINGLWGESGDGKSWVALYTCAQEIDRQNHVIYIDYEDDEIGTCSRLLQLGLDADDIFTYFHYFWPDAPATLDDVTDNLKRVIDQHQPTLVVIDSTGESMAVDSVKPNDDDAVARWFRRLPKWFSKAGLAVVVIDHVVKDREGRGLYAIGSQRKRAAINGAAYMVEAIKPIGQDVAGFSKLTTAKDRNGTYLRGHKAAEFHLDCTNGTRAVLRAPDVNFRPTTLMEKTSKALEGLDEPISTRQLQMLVEGKNDDSKKLALELLVEEGYVNQEAARKGFTYLSVRPYREDDVFGDLVAGAFREVEADD